MYGFIRDSSPCKCDLLKSCEERKVLDIQGNLQSPILFLLSCKHKLDITEIMFSYFKIHGYSRDNAAFLYALGCSPSEYYIADSPKSFLTCKKYNIKKLIERIKPKVIITEGKALYSIVEDTNVKYSYFYNLNTNTTFWTPEFSCWVIPIPAVTDWIGVTDRNKNLRLLDNYTSFFTARQLKTIKHRLNSEMKINEANMVTVDDPVKFLEEHTNDAGISKVAVDIETTGLSFFKDKIISIQLCWDGKNGYFIGWDTSSEFIQALDNFLKGKYLIGANYSFDTKFLRYNGVVSHKFSSDTNYLAHFVDSGRGVSLKANTYYHTEFGGYENELDRYKRKYKIKDYSNIPISILSEYAAMDTVVTWRLEDILLNLLDDAEKKLFYDIYFPMTQIMVDAEYYGMHIDMEYLIKLRDEYKSKIQAVEDVVHKTFPETKLSSADHVGKMFEDLKAKDYGRKKNGKYITSEDRLLKWKRDGISLADQILEYRRYSTVVKTYLSEKAGLVKGYNPEDGRVHANFNFQHNKVGRLSCSGPNLQNIPIKDNKDFRPIFKAASGYYLAECDFAGFHLRLVAMASGDPTLVKMFTSDMKDMHSKTASVVFTDYSVEEFLDRMANGTDEERKQLKEFRSMAKPINFGLIYGMAYKTLAETVLMQPPPDGWPLGRVQQYLDVNKETIGEDVFSYLGLKSSTNQEINNRCKFEACAKSIREKFFKEYQGVDRWIKQMHVQGSRDGFITTMYGFKVWLSEFSYLNTDGREKAISLLKNGSVNWPIIGTEANIMHRAQVQIGQFFKENKLDVRIVNQVHDSLVIEFKEDLLDVIRDPVMEIMTRDYPEYGGIPIDAEGCYGKCWGGYDRMPWNLWFDSSKQ